MTVKNVFDERETQPGAALGAAFPDIDAIEALGQSRHVLWRDARPVVAHSNLRLGRPSAAARLPQRDFDPLAGAPYLSAFSTRFSNTRTSSS